MISRRQAAPSRYQHIISGLVQPLNHTRHRNPLVSVTFSPTQEARSQSAIWMLWPFSFRPPPLPPTIVFSTFPNPGLPLPFLHLLHTMYFHLCPGHQSPCKSSHRSISLIPPKKKNIFPPRASKMCSTQGNLTAGEVTLFPVSCLERVKFWCDNQTAFIHLEIDGTWRKKNCTDGDSHLIFLFFLLLVSETKYISIVQFLWVYTCVYITVYKVAASHTKQTKRFKYRSSQRHVDTTNTFCLCLCADYFCL